MKVAISVSGTDLDASVDPRFGRAERFLIYDVESGAYHLLDNVINLNAAQGAGIQTATQISNAGVSAVITGNVGPKAFRTLQAAGIVLYLFDQGSAAQAIEQLQAGKLQPAEQASKAGHWM